MLALHRARLGSALRYKFTDCEFDTDRRELSRSGEAVPVEPQVYDLLAYLISNNARVVSKDELLAVVWKGRIVSESAMNTRINAARSAVGDNGYQQHIIKTARRTGFRFIATVQEVDADRQKPFAGQSALSKPSLAVLAFRNGEQDPAERELAADLVEQLSSLLFRSPWLSVSKVDGFGTRTDARYLLGGSVRKSANTVRASRLTSLMRPPIGICGLIISSAYSMRCWLLKTGSRNSLWARLYLRSSGWRSSGPNTHMTNFLMPGPAPCEVSQASIGGRK